MSFAGQVLWNRQTIGACDLAIIGNPSAAPAAAPPVAAFRNLRRDAADERDWAFAGTGTLRVMTPPNEMASERRDGVVVVVNPECRGGSGIAAPRLSDQCIP